MMRDKRLVRFTRHPPGDLFEPDQLLPSQFFASRVSAEKLGPRARLFRAIVDSALNALTKERQLDRHQALEWIRDLDGKGAAHLNAVYPCTFAEAVERGYVGLDPEVLSLAIVRRYGQQVLAREAYLQARVTREARTRAQERVHA